MPAIGMGKFDYKMIIEVGNLGQQTKVQISPNHGFNQISARLENQYYYRRTLLTEKRIEEKNKIQTSFQDSRLPNN